MDLEVPVYMEIPLGYTPEHDERQRKYVLKLNKSLYGLKLGSYNWFEKLKKDYWTGVSNRAKSIPVSLWPLEL